MFERSETDGEELEGDADAIVFDLNGLRFGLRIGNGLLVVVVVVGPVPGGRMDCSTISQERALANDRARRRGRVKRQLALPR